MKTIAILLTVVCSLLVPATGYMALFAGMAMDAPGSEKSSGKRLFVLSMMLSPVILFITVIYAWRSIGDKDFAAALLWCLLGIIPFVMAMLLLYFDWFEP